MPEPSPIPLAPLLADTGDWMRLLFLLGFLFGPALARLLRTWLGGHAGTTGPATSTRPLPPSRDGWEQILEEELEPEGPPSVATRSGDDGRAVSWEDLLAGRVQAPSEPASPPGPPRPQAPEPARATPRAAAQAPAARPQTTSAPTGADASSAPTSGEALGEALPFASQMEAVSENRLEAGLPGAHSAAWISSLDPQRASVSPPPASGERRLQVGSWRRAVILSEILGRPAALRSSHWPPDRLP